MTMGNPMIFFSGWGHEGGWVVKGRVERGREGRFRDGGRRRFALHQQREEKKEGKTGTYICKQMLCRPGPLGGEIWQKYF